MSHFRKINVGGKDYEYKVGKQATFVKGVGEFQHCKFAFCVDVSMDVWKVTPKRVRKMIEGSTVNNA
jgi:hypothetical protein